MSVTPNLLLTVLATAGLLVSNAALAEGDDALTANDCVPQGELRGDASRGADLHLENCADCHGAGGQTDVIVMHMDEPPADQSNPEYMRTLTDAFLYLAICRGGEAVGRSIIMEAWGDYFTDQEIKDLVAHIRTFSGT
ncbi:MAG: cytochrome c [Gammaproteobacteria bacterium]|nr:cytochrome c [Gammaproteobacteria bacterium]